jgi:Family of unknown function (DUF6011)
MKKRKGPALGSQPPRNTTDAYQSTAAPHEPVTAEDRHEQKILGEAARLGYRLAVQCRCCGSWLVADRSVREFIGPVCRAREVD